MVTVRNTPSDLAPRLRACESCREAKIRCKSSQQPGICQKCIESKKECVVRTGPRIRRSRKAVLDSSVSSNHSPAAAAAGRETGPSSTFTIDFALTAEPEPDDTLDMLRSMHETHIDTILPSTEDGAGFEHDMDLPSSAYTPSSSTREYSITDLDGKPQFNLASAASLLEHFRHMLPQLPCIEIPQGTTVRSLAATKPFLLLAILTSASAAKTFQGYTLYDAEFRKVLGLKFVAAGEKTLELLQGLLVYCIWYPFHIRPQSRQMFRYKRMIGDLVQDLGLHGDHDDPALLQGSEEHLERLRAFLGCSYLEAVFTSSWRPYRRNPEENTAWVLRCCETLQTLGTGACDMVLATLAKQGIMHAQAAAAIFARGQQTEDQRRLLLLGILARSHELRNSMPPEIGCASPVKLTMSFLEIYINSAGLLNGHGQQGSSFGDDTLKPESIRLVNAVAPTRQFLESILALDQVGISILTAIDWCRIIIAIIIAIRLSLPMADCPDFDSTWARSEIQLNDFLRRLSASDADLHTSTKTDTLMAIRVVLEIVQKKFEQRVQAAELREAEAMRDSARFGCPFMDGSLDEYLAQWNPDLSTEPTVATAGTLSQGEGIAAQSSRDRDRQPVFHDMWATMTMSWASQEP